MAKQGSQMANWHRNYPHAAPCRDCPDRKPNCHSTCEKYLKFREEREKVYKARQDYNDSMDFYIDSILRHKNGGGRYGRK